MDIDEPFKTMLAQPTGWLQLTVDNDPYIEVHVLPCGDTRQHEIKESCWCEPALDPEAPIPVYSHNAHDGRETASIH